LVDVHTMDQFKGMFAVAAACFTSGLAGVYFEMVLKGSTADVWVRNVQLSLFSLLPAISPIIVAYAGSGIENGGTRHFTSLFENFGGWAWATVATQVVGGLVTAMVIKYSDNILKGFATSLSIVISFLASVALFDFHLTFTFVLGTVIVLIATWLYNQPPRKPSPISNMIRDVRNEPESSIPLMFPSASGEIDEHGRLSRSLSMSSLSASSSSHALSDSAYGWEKDKQDV